MPRTISERVLFSAAPGLSRSLRVVRYGDPDARPKVYIHAALHADEAPGLLVCHHLLELLDAADARGEIRGQIVVVPYANPIGLGQSINGDHLGRFELSSGANFNRGWPDLTEAIAARVSERLTDDAEANRRLIRQAISDTLAERKPSREVDSLYLTLASEAFDADLVLDLHCDDEGLMHLFLHPPLWPEMSDLAAELESRAVFLQSHNSAWTFTDACAAPWLNLAERFADRPIPHGCIACTVELRGFIDVDDTIAHRDAQALVNVLRRRGFLAGEAPELPPLMCDATPLSAVDLIRTPTFGILIYRAELGERVEKGQPIADIVDPAAPRDDGTRFTVRSGTDGIVVTRRQRRLVSPHQVIAKIAGSEALGYRTGYLLED